MKISKKTALASILLSALLLLGFRPHASAIVLLDQNNASTALVFLDGPDATLPYDPQAGGVNAGVLSFKLLGDDTGHFYPTGVGTRGFGAGSPDGLGSVAAGQALLDTAPFLPPNPGASVPKGPAVGQVAGEDTWGVVLVTDILAYGSDGNLHTVYNRFANPYQVTGMFYNEKDFYVNESAGIVAGAGLKFDLYTSNIKNFSDNPGPAQGGVVGPNGPDDRTAANAFPTVTTSNAAGTIQGTPFLTLASTAGLIRTAGDLGGTATEFESNLTGLGRAAFNVTGGSSQGLFDTNSVGFGGVVAPNGTGLADLFATFTSGQGLAGWDIRVNDPITAVIPEPTSVLAGLACLLPACGSILRRRRK